jgi:prepilin-type N-terminal cleavage/methylation domain-containing protein/prepilin-type processing-associated H-X9-DG protein
MRSDQNRGFTLIELLVVIAVISLLVAFLLPAVQGAREAARRMQCVNNLKQLGVALHSYESTYRAFPPGYVSNFDASGNDTGPGWGWALLLLPQIEQKPLFDAVNLNLPIEDAGNPTCRLTRIAVYLCPSDDQAPSWLAMKRDASGTPIRSICQVASANYVGMYGTSDPGIDGDGVFFRDSFITIAAILDGTAYTIAAGERGHSLGEATWVGSVTGAALFPVDNDGIGYPRVESGPGIILGHAGGNLGPGDPNAEVNQFYSRHPGGVNFLFCDGHVSFLKTTLNSKTFRALATRAGAEVLSGDY